MRNDKVLAFLALVFVALFSYWTFNQIKQIRDNDQNKSFEELPDTSSTFTENTDDANESATTDENTVTPTWTATDYVKGDIAENPYTVKSGDTLWEIAEGYYGDGSMWVNILNANSSQVGFLANGQQALIFPGQSLTLP